MERLLFSSSFVLMSAPSPLLRPNSPTRFANFDLHSRTRLFLEHLDRHSPQHLHFARLAFQDWSRTNVFLHKENGSLYAAASLLSFVHSFQAINAVTSTLFSKSKPRDQACHCSAEHGSRLNEPATIDHFDENVERLSRKRAGNSVRCDGDAAADEQVSTERNGTALEDAESRLSDGIVGDGVTGTEEVKFNEKLTPSVEGSPIPVKEPIYEVLEVKLGGIVVTKRVSRRLLLKTSGLRLRDIRSVDPSLFVTNSAPALLIRDQAILLNLGSLRAIASADNVLVFDYKSVGAKAFLDLLLQRLNPDSNSGVPTMPFELEVVEAALLSRTQRLERRLMEVEPRVLSLLEVLPNCLTANVLEELRLSKQALVELGSKAGALRQMLLELLESPQEIRRMTIMGRRCSISKEDGSVECMASTDKQLADDEEEEMEMLLENYLQRCESCHGQAERLLDSAKETEDSIAVNLSSRRLEVSRLELLLQVGTFCSALGALVAGIFGMNLKSYLEGNAIAFWLTTAGIVLGGIVLFFFMYNHLKQKKIL